MALRCKGRRIKRGTLEVGTIYINLGALLGGAWLNFDILGGVFRDIAYALPFAHSVDAARLALSGSFSGLIAHMLWSSGYAAATFILAVFAFRKKMKA